MAEFQEELEAKRYSFKDLTILKKFALYFKPYLPKFFLILFCSIFTTFLFNIEPLMMRFLLNYLNGDEETNLLAICLSLVIADVVAMLVASIGQFFLNLGLKKLGQAVIYDIRNSLFEHILSLSQGQLKGLPIGSYVTRLTNDTQNLSTFFSDVLPQFLRALITLITIIVVSISFTGVYGLIYLAYLPVVFILSYFFRKKAKVYYRGEKKAVSKMNSFLSEAFSGIKVTKTYGKENRKMIEFDRANEEIKNTFLKSQNLFAIFYPLMYLLQMSCVVIILSFGIPAMFNRTMLTGDFNMLYSYSTQFFSPIQTITQLMNQLQQIISSAERVEAIQELKPEITDADDAIDVPSFKGKIEFRHVYFAYVSDNYVLKDVSFIISPGQTAAFVGATGAGKSTIISLISRIYEPNKGEILIDDIDIRRYSLTCLRRNIGIMLQDVFLFSGSIASNISLDSPDVSLEEVEKGAEFVGADSFIKRLPKGYQEEVTERGENFSAGQRQLISFARTLVYHPSLMLLDEATANIDTETEHLIQDSLEKMRTIGTMVIVAHRLSTIKNADIIFVVSKGEIIERGNHQELLKLKGNYYNLYRLQNMASKVGHLIGEQV